MKLARFVDIAGYGSAEVTKKNGVVRQCQSKELEIAHVGLHIKDCSLKLHNLFS